MADHVRVRSGIFNGLKHMLKTGIDVIRISNGSNSLDNKALVLSNVKNLHRLLIYQLCYLTIELPPTILTVMQHNYVVCLLV